MSYQFASKITKSLDSLSVRVAFALALLALLNLLPFPSQSPALSSGKLLIASDLLNDSYFGQTVILLTHYSDREAAGLIINRPLQVPVSAALPGIQSYLEQDPGLYEGGPVSIQTIRILVNSRITISNSIKIHKDLYYLDDQTALGDMLTARLSDNAYRFYAGYAGWAAGQLESEISRGAWHVMDVDDISLFEIDTELLWPKLITLANGLWASLPL